MKVDIIAGRDEILYCSKKCAISDGHNPVTFKELPSDADPEECAENYGQLCPYCEEQYHYTSKLYE